MATSLAWPYFYFIEEALYYGNDFTFLGPLQRLDFPLVVLRRGILCRKALIRKSVTWNKTK